MKKYLTFRKFDNPDEANAVLELLSSNNIPGRIEEERALLDTNLIGQQFDLPYCLKISPDNFTAAEELLRNSTDLSVAEPDKDYYLLTFSDEELMEVIDKKDEWGNYDYALALKLLRERGITLTAEDIERAHAQRVQALAKPDNGSSLWTVAGYFIAAIGGLLGLFIGIFLMTAKKTLPDGSRVHAYSGNARMHGRFITGVAVVAMVCWVFYAVYFQRLPPGVGSIFGALAMLKL